MDITCLSIVALPIWTKRKRYRLVSNSNVRFISCYLRCRFSGVIGYSLGHSSLCQGKGRIYLWFSLMCNIFVHRHHIYNLILSWIKLMKKFSSAESGIVNSVFLSSSPQYAVWLVLWVTWNVFVICFYLEAGDLSKVIYHWIYLSHQLFVNMPLVVLCFTHSFCVT